MQYFIILLLTLSTSVIAQSIHLDSVKKIKQTTYQYKNGVAKMTIVKTSIYDTNQVLIQQDRYNYTKVDTAYVPITHYHYDYTPQYKKGNYYTERLTHPSKPKREYSKQTTKFKSYDHTNKRVWVKLYKKNSLSSLQKQTQNKYDKNGNIIDIEVTEYKKYSTTKHTEKMQRNPAGNITKWESFDDDGDSRMQARSYEASYKDDTLLLKSVGYLYFNWNQTINKYSGKRELKKSIQTVGNRALNGKVSILDKNMTIYRNGMPYKRIEKKLNKKVKTIWYTYEDGKEIETIETPEKSYKEVKVFSYTDTLNLLTKYTETASGKPFLEIHIEYDTLYRMAQHTEIEYRQNGKDWKTVKTYNPQGNITSKRFYISNEIRREEVYEYQYFPPPPPPEEEKDEQEEEK